MVNTICVVACCKKEAYPGCGVPFHRVPGHPAIRKKWIEAIPGTITNSSAVCGAHFRDHDYVSSARKRLKFGVVPSVFPNCQLWLRIVGSDGVVHLPAEEVQNLQACQYHRNKYLKDVIHQSTNPPTDQTTDQVNLRSSGVGNTAVNCIKNKDDKNTGFDRNVMVSVNRDEAFDDNYDISSESGDENQDYNCNECQKLITGFRYTCVQCADWDLCGACEASAAHAAHYVLRVPRRRKLEETKAILDAIKKKLLEDNLLRDDRRLVEKVQEVPRASSECASVKSEDGSGSEYIVETLDEWSSEGETDREACPPKRLLPPETDQSVPSKKAKLRPASPQIRKEISTQNKPVKILSKTKLKDKGKNTNF